MFASAATPTTLGYVAAVTAAVLWAVATMFYGRAGKVLPPIQLNFVKGVFTTLLFAATILAVDAAGFGELRRLDAWRLALLAGSGVLGIAVGDSLYFACVNLIGPRQVALLSLLATPLVVVGGAIWLGESLLPPAWVGVALTVLGIAWVITERPREAEAAPVGTQVAPLQDTHPPILTRRIVVIGVLCGLGAAVCQAVGMVMNRASVGDLDTNPLGVALWRILTSTAAMLPILFFFKRGTQGRPRATLSLWLLVAFAALLGTYAGIWLQQIAIGNAPAGPVQALLSTTPVWVLPLAAMAGERVSLRAILGALVAVAGVVLLIAADWLWAAVAS